MACLLNPCSSCFINFYQKHHCWKKTGKGSMKIFLNVRYRYGTYEVIHLLKGLWSYVNWRTYGTCVPTSISLLFLVFNMNTMNTVDTNLIILIWRQSYSLNIIFLLSNFILIPKKVFPQFHLFIFCQQLITKHTQFIRCLTKMIISISTLKELRPKLRSKLERSNLDLMWKEETCNKL